MRWVIWAVWDKLCELTLVCGVVEVCGRFVMNGAIWRELYVMKCVRRVVWVAFDLSCCWGVYWICDGLSCLTWVVCDRVCEFSCVSWGVWCELNEMLWFCVCEFSVRCWRSERRSNGGGGGGGGGGGRQTRANAGCKTKPHAVMWGIKWIRAVSLWKTICFPNCGPLMCYATSPYHSRPFFLPVCHGSSVSGFFLALFLQKTSPCIPPTPTKKVRTSGR